MDYTIRRAIPKSTFQPHEDKLLMDTVTDLQARDCCKYVNWSLVLRKCPELGRFSKDDLRRRWDFMINVEKEKERIRQKQSDIEGRRLIKKNKGRSVTIITNEREAPTLSGLRQKNTNLERTSLSSTKTNSFLTVTTRNRRQIANKEGIRSEHGYIQNAISRPITLAGLGCLTRGYFKLPSIHSANKHKLQNDRKEPSHKYKEKTMDSVSMCSQVNQGREESALVEISSAKSIHADPIKLKLLSALYPSWRYASLELPNGINRHALIFALKWIQPEERELFNIGDAATIRKIFRQNNICTSGLDSEVYFIFWKYVAPHLRKYIQMRLSDCSCRPFGVLLYWSLPHFQYNVTKTILGLTEAGQLERREMTWWEEGFTRQMLDFNSNYFLDTFDRFAKVRDVFV